MQDDIKGNVPVAFVKLKNGVEKSEELEKKVDEAVINVIGKYGKLHKIFFVDALPTTITGKIMRRVLRDILNYGEVKGDLSAIDDPRSIDVIKSEVKKWRGSGSQRKGG